MLGYFNYQVSDMYRYFNIVLVILLLLFTHAGNEKSSDYSSSRMEAKLMPISNAKRLALVIGNGDYQFVNSLSNPVNDARDVAAALHNLNYETIVLINASYQAMLDGVRRFVERLAKFGSVGLFYFSGHGLQSGGSNYLIPVDAKIKTEDDIKPLGLDANYVLAKMNEAKTQNNIMILDACRNGKGLVQITPLSVGTFISFATLPMQTAWGEATGRDKPDDRGWGRGNRPVINVSWYDAIDYAEWLSQETGYTYRLPTEVEWEYAARAGTNTKYWWGDRSSHKYANYNKVKYTLPVGSFSANQFGLHDTVGNVWEWTCSKYTYKYNGEEQRCIEANDKSKVILRGGSWNSKARYARSSNRGRGSRNDSNDGYGFRLVRVLSN